MTKTHNNKSLKSFFFCNFPWIFPARALHLGKAAFPCRGSLLPSTTETAGSRHRRSRRRRSRGILVYTILGAEQIVYGMLVWLLPLGHSLEKMFAR